MKQTDETTIKLLDGATLRLEAPDSDGDIWAVLDDGGGDLTHAYVPPAAQTKIVEFMSDDGVPANAVKAKDVPLNEALIRVAAAHNATISFRYAKGPGQPVEARSFAPKSVKVLPDHVTFVGYDEDRDGMRSFRSDRIKGLVAVNV